MTKYDAILVGSGIGSLSTGLLLQKAGKKVLILEKKSVVGGRLASYKKDGFTLDIGVHLISRSNKGPLGQLHERAGIESKIEWKKVRPLTSFNGEIFKYPHDLEHMIPAEDFAGVMRFMGDIMTRTPKEVDSFNNISTKELLNNYTTNDLAHACVSSITMIYVTVPSWECSAGEFMRCVRYEAAARASGYPTGGCGAISGEISDAFRELGGELLLNTPVEKIVIENNKAVGVVANGKLYESDVIISNADIKDTVKDLVGEQYFDGDYVERVKNLDYSWSAYLLRAALDEHITDLLMLSQIGDSDQQRYYDRIRKGDVPEDLNIFLIACSNFDESVAPEGKQLINFGAPLPLDLPPETLEKIPELMLKSVEKYIPNIREHLVFLDHATPDWFVKEVGKGGSVIGIGQTVGQVGSDRPQVKTSIEGLYLVGGTAGGEGVGIELCINSAFELVDNYLLAK